jgi:hypothetical protein
MRTFSRPITTFDEVPLRSFWDHRVDLKRKTAEVSSGRLLAKVSPRAERGPQGLRRPRFSFFLFNCQTARNPAGPAPGTPESRRSFVLPMRLSEAWSPNISEVLRRRDIAPKADGAPYQGYIVFNPTRCQQGFGPKIGYRPGSASPPARRTRWVARAPWSSCERSAGRSGAGPELAANGTSGRETYAATAATTGFKAGRGGTGKRSRAEFRAALRPHSSAVLMRSGGRYQFGGLRRRVNHQ